MNVVGIKICQITPHYFAALSMYVHFIADKVINLAALRLITLRL